MEEGVVAVTCEECNGGEVKYCCPRCSIRTCSLKCVNAHKSRINCNGKRDQFVIVGNEGVRNLKSLKLDDLVKDIAFLEQIEKKNDSSKRQFNSLIESLEDIGLEGDNPIKRFKGNNSRHPPSSHDNDTRSRSESFRSDDYFEKRGAKWMRLKSALKERKTRILYMPLGMSRQKRNNTFFKAVQQLPVRDQKSKSGINLQTEGEPSVEKEKPGHEIGIYWTIEVKYEKQIVTIDSIFEGIKLSELLTTIYKEIPSLNKNSTVRRFLINEDKATKIEKPMVELIDMNSTLLELLRWQTVIEYPTFVMQ